MNIYTVSLFGHRSLLNPLSVEEHLEHEVYKILKNHSYVKFLIGRTGEFDLMAALTIRRVMKAYSRMYDKSVSKIDKMCETAQQLPSAPTLSYLLCDRWYPCRKLMEAFIKK